MNIYIPFNFFNFFFLIFIIFIYLNIYLQEFSARVSERRAFLTASVLPEPQINKNMKSNPSRCTSDAADTTEKERIITLQFRFRNSTNGNSTGTRRTRRFNASTATTGDLLNYVESLEMHPLLTGEPILTLDFPTRVVSRSSGDCDALLVDAGVHTDSVVWVTYDLL